MDNMDPSTEVDDWTFITRRMYERKFELQFNINNTGGVLQFMREVGERLQSVIINCYNSGKYGVSIGNRSHDASSRDEILTIIDQNLGSDSRTST